MVKKSPLEQKNLEKIEELIIVKVEILEMKEMNSKKEITQVLTEILTSETVMTVVEETLETVERVEVGTLTEAEEEITEIIDKGMEEGTLERYFLIMTGIAINVVILISHLGPNVIGVENLDPESGEEIPEVVKITGIETMEEMAAGAVETMGAEIVEETAVEAVEIIQGETLTEMIEIVETEGEDFQKEMIQIQIQKDRSQNRIIFVKLEEKDLVMHITMLPNPSSLESLNEIDLKLGIREFSYK